MRNLFFALVLANLAFAAWTMWYAAPSPASSTPRETGMTIRLVGEADAGSAEGAAPPSAIAAADPRVADVSERDTTEPDASAADARGADPGGTDARYVDTPNASDRCVTIGPFPTEAGAEAAAAALDAAGFAPSSRSTEGEIWVGFWVHIAAIPTRAAANEMLAQLRENGLPDAYLIPGEEDGDIISLGVFNDMTRAGRLEQQVRRIGLEPVIAERSRPGIVRWLDVTVPAGRELDLGALGIRLDRIQQLRCPSGG